MKYFETQNGVLVDSPENRTMILAGFLKTYNSLTDYHNLEGCDEDEIIDKVSEIVILDFNAGRLPGERAMNEMLRWIFFQLNKITKCPVENIDVVESENMPRNYSETETKNLRLFMDVLLEFFQDRCEESNLGGGIEEDNFMMDTLNFIKKVMPAEKIRYDATLSQKECFRSLYVD